jgi:hypothetical protein
MESSISIPSLMEELLLLQNILFSNFSSYSGQNKLHCFEVHGLVWSVSNKFNASPFCKSTFGWLLEVDPISISSANFA